MNSLYQGQITEIENCPPADYRKLDKVKCYRFVYETINHPDNFKAPAEKVPKVINNKSEEKKCSFYALSFLDTLNNAIEFYTYLEGFISKIDLKIGTHIAEGYLYKEDGIAGTVEENGHFNFHPTVSNQFLNNFRILNSIEKIK